MLSSFLLVERGEENARRTEESRRERERGGRAIHPTAITVIVDRATN